MNINRQILTMKTMEKKVNSGKPHIDNKKPRIEDGQMAQGALDHNWENRLANVQQGHQPSGQAIKHAVLVKVLL